MECLRASSSSTCRRASDSEEVWRRTESGKLRAEFFVPDPSFSQQNGFSTLRDNLVNFSSQVNFQLPTLVFFFSVCPMVCTVTRKKGYPQRKDTLDETRLVSPPAPASDLGDPEQKPPFGRGCENET